MSQQDDSHSKQFLPDLQRTVLKSSPLFDYIRNGEFKRLLGRIRATLEAEQAHSVSILSAQPQEGKTFLVAAIALGYAILLQKRVLIVNTVLGASAQSLSLQDLYDSELKYAPVNGVARWNRMIDLISPQEQETKKSQFDTVDFMVGQFLDSFKDKYDLIIVDTCALGAAQSSMMDPIVIAGQTDASLFVTSRNSLTRESVAEAKGLLDQWKVKIIGSIHNVAAPERRKGGLKK
jgi:Mrp family chromosome partitioning ATPase